MPKSFSSAVHSCPRLKEHYRDGLDALSKDERSKINSKAVEITGSVDVDKALSQTHPNDPRWDYGIGYRSRTQSQADDKVLWVEFHPATSGEVKKIIAKKRFNQRWMKDNAASLAGLEGKYVWIATGNVGIQRHHPQYRLLEMNAVILRGQRHDIE